MNRTLLSTLTLFLSLRHYNEARFARLTQLMSESSNISSSSSPEKKAEEKEAETTEAGRGGAREAEDEGPAEAGARAWVEAKAMAESAKAFGRDVQPALIGRHYVN